MGDPIISQIVRFPPKKREPRPGELNRPDHGTDLSKRYQRPVWVRVLPSAQVSATILGNAGSAPLCAGLALRDKLGLAAQDADADDEERECGDEEDEVAHHHEGRGRDLGLLSDEGVEESRHSREAEHPAGRCVEVQ